MESTPGITFRAASRRWLRRLGTALLPWTVVACAAALTLTADGPAQRLDYVKALIWPVVAVVVVWSLRDLLRTKFGQVEQVDALGVAMKFRVAQEAAQQLQDDVRDAVAELDATDAPVEMRVTEAGETSDAELARAAAEAEQRRRAAIESLVETAALLGYAMIDRGQPPKIGVTWTEDGEPKVRIANPQPLDPHDLARTLTSTDRSNLWLLAMAARDKLGGKDARQSPHQEW
ncbi:hypothetical protein ACQP00_22135 [Dactylosporangium sp. CS-047395]|uniref:hypothetical protein n=1 Tax=Dactylosporangium sp. CS-047395 TaxID=3239936 RepID=UPI003D8A0972